MSNPLILGTNSIKDTGYEVANSLRFNGGSSDYITRTLGSGDDRRKFTFSWWMKRATPGTDYFISGMSGSNEFNFFFDSSGRFGIDDFNGSAYGFQLRTNRVFRDISAWMHFCLAFDTTQGTSTNRIKLYINGTQYTWDNQTTQPSQNYELQTNISGRVLEIGRLGGSYNTSYADMYLAEMLFIDGSALAPTSFGEFDSDTNIWKPIDVSGLTFGTNGFYLDFENSGSLGADVSGNGNNFTLNNLTSIDQTTDTCTNNFAVLNALDNYYPDSTLSEGNTQTVIGAGDWTPIKATFGLTTGKWYWEIKHSAVSSGSSYATIGVDSNQATGDQQRGGAGTNDYSYWYNGELRTGDSAVTTGVGTYGVGDIIGVALDLDNNKLYFSKNGTFVNSGDPTSGSTGTGAMSITSASSTSLGAYFPEVGFYDNTNTGTFQCNFGNPAFSISSGNSDGNGYGNFEYAVPANYYSLCSKNLAEYG